MFTEPSRFHTGPISGVAAFGDYIATAGYDNKIVLWNANSHTPINRAYHDHLANQCEFSPDGRYLASAGSDYMARIFSVPDLRLLAVVNHADDVLKATFSPDSKRLATCDYNGAVRISKVTGECLKECCGHEGLVERLAWSADGATSASCGTDGKIIVWDTATGDRRFTRSGLQTDVDDIVYFSEDIWIAGADDGRLLFIGPDTDWSMPAHSAGIKSLSRRGDRLLSTGYDQRFIVWSIGTDRQLKKIIDGALPPQVWARSGCLVGEDKAIFASFGSRYLVCDIARQSWESSGYVPSPSLNAVGVQDGKVYAIGDAGVLNVDSTAIATVPSLCNAVAVVDGRVLIAGQTGMLFEARTGKILYAHGAPINRIEIIETGLDGSAEIVLGGYDGAIVRMSLRGNTVSSVRAIHVAPSAIKGICHRDGRIFCGSAGGMLAVVDAHSDEILHRAEGAHTSILNDVSFYRGGFITVSRDRTMRFWTPEGTSAGCVATRHSRSVKCVSTSDDGCYSASGSYGGTIDVYDHAAGNWLGSLRRPTMAGISSLAWHAERQSFVAASYDGGIYEVLVHEH